MHKLFVLYLVIVWSLLLPVATPTKHFIAKGETSLGNNYLLYWYDNVVWKVDQNTPKAEPFLELPSEDNYFYSNIKYFDRVENIIYFLEHEGEQYGFVNRLSRIVRYNISSKTKNIVWVGENITAYTFSPDKSQIAIRHLQPYTEENYNRPLPEFCILEISKNECNYITDNLPTHTGTLRWVNDHILWYFRGRNLATFDLETGENDTVELDEWYIMSWAHLSSKYFYSVGLNLATSTMHFIQLDILTKRVLPLNYLPDVEIVPQLVPKPSLISISPNKRYIFYSLSDTDYQIIDLMSGSRSNIILGSPENVRSGIHWYPNSEGFLITTIVDYRTNYLSESLIYVKSDTGEKAIIESFELSPNASSHLVIDI